MLSSLLPAAATISRLRAKSHDYVTGGIQYDWHLNTETGAYDACTASVSYTECGSPLTQALTVKREVARTDCTQERTVTYTATGTINGVAASDTMTDILPAGTHEVDPTQWTSDENTHWHVCANCDVRVDEAAHTGGSATTTERARCEICGQEYGELLPRTYTVKFEANGGEGTMDDQIFTYDVAQALTANAFTKTDRTFACWKDANGNTYTDGQTLLNLLTEGTITLTAMWTVNTPALKASYMISTGKPYIMWNAVSGADKYEVYRSGNSYGTYECIGTATATNYTDSTANAGYTYYYKVKAVSKVNSTANSAFSTVVSITAK